MICPFCNVNMHHLNAGGGFAEQTKYQTYDFLECPNCHETAVEFYHTEFVRLEDLTGKKPEFTMKPIEDQF